MVTSMHLQKAISPFFPFVIQLSFKQRLTSLLTNALCHIPGKSVATNKNEEKINRKRKLRRNDKTFPSNLLPDSVERKSKEQQNKWQRKTQYRE